jgi:hypothetical protein
MNLVSKFMAIPCILYVAPTCCLARDTVNMQARWIEVATNVFQATESDGSITRMAFGDEGKAYDVAVIADEIRQLDRRISANGTAALQDKKSQNELEQALAGMSDDSFELGPRPLVTDGGVLCGEFPFELDSHFAVGKVGATAVARVAFGSMLPLRYFHIQT